MKVNHFVGLVCLQEDFRWRVFGFVDPEVEHGVQGQAHADTHDQEVVGGGYAHASETYSQGNLNETHKHPCFEVTPTFNIQ